MGRTVPTYRTVLESIIKDWDRFRRALRKSERESFDRMMRHAREHSAAATMSARLNPTEALFMAVLLEHERTLEQLRDATATATGVERDREPPSTTEDSDEDSDDGGR